MPSNFGSRSSSCLWAQQKWAFTQEEGQTARTSTWYKANARVSFVFYCILMLTCLSWFFFVVVVTMIYCDWMWLWGMLIVIMVVFISLAVIFPWLQYVIYIVILLVSLSYISNLNLITTSSNFVLQVVTKLKRLF